MYEIICYRPGEDSIHTVEHTEDTQFWAVQLVDDMNEDEERAGSGYRYYFRFRAAKCDYCYGENGTHHPQCPKYV